MAIETERRFLIKMPDADLLSALGGDEIEQIYLQSEDDITARIRSRRHNGQATYTHTKKQHISKISSIEDETVIGENEFRALSEMREEGTVPIRKTRYVLPYRGYDFEIDVYSFWRNAAVMEVELPEEGAKFELPPGVTVIREISLDRSFSNHSLSRRIIPEDELLSEE